MHCKATSPELTTASKPDSAKPRALSRARFAAASFPEFVSTTAFRPRDLILARIKSRGRKAVVLTNSGKDAAANLARLSALGFAESGFDAVVSSGDVALQCIKKGLYQTSD